MEVYKRANIDRKLFSKIRSQRLHPNKRTVIALAVGLELSIETDDLLSAPDTLFSKQSSIIVEYFITNEKYDIIEINTVSSLRPTVAGSLERKNSAKIWILP